MTRLLAVDGHNLLYRAFFAIPELSNKAGRPTNAVFGFIRMLRQLDRLWKPTHWLVLFDGGLPAERLELLPEYKANRPPMPDRLREQLATVEEYLDRASVPRLRLDAVEADDLIASLADRTAPDVPEFLIVSSDKDLYQLVDSRVAIVPPSKPEVRIDAAEVEKKTGVPPGRIAEWLALTGDNVDNIPGVPGMGPKTAAKLLSGCGSLLELLDHPEGVRSETQRRSLVEERDRILRNLRMVRLQRDVAGLPPLAELRVRPADPSRLLPFYEEMEFHSLARDLRTGSLFGDGV